MKNNEFRCYNLHTHTFRCGHARGDLPELIDVAKDNGYTTLGISEHTILNDDMWPDMRLGKHNVDDYFDTIERYRDIESGKSDGITVLSGLECDGVDRYFSYYKEIKDKYKIDYLLTAFHFFYYKNKLVYVYDDRYENQNKIRAYGDCLIKAIESGLFLYVAHPDMFMTSKEKWDSYTNDVMRDVIRASKEYKVPLEINLNGYMKGLVRKGLNLVYQYPVEQLWELVAIENGEVVIGIDAHSPRQFAVDYPDLDKMLEKYDFNLLSEGEILKRVDRA